MAPTGESCYFPPLDRCLDGRHQLFSWKTTYVGLSQLDHFPENGPLKRHLTDHQTLSLLTEPFSPFSLPTPRTKSSFETKTSAIHVPPSAQGRYDIKQIQDDALWLSKETHISETDALRITVLEWQSRPAQRLLRESSHEVANLQSSVGISGFAGSLRSSILSPTLASEQDASKAFVSSDARRQRLLLTYLSERRYILKTSEYVVFAAMFQTSLHAEPSPGSNRKGKAPDRPRLQAKLDPSRSQGKAEWVAEVGNKILTHWNLDGQMEHTDKNFIVCAVDALEARIKDLEKGSGWFREAGSPEEIETAWVRNQILETVHIMQTTLTVLDSCTKLTRTDALIAWFRFVHKYGFFEGFDLSDYGVQGPYEMPLQSLVTLISLALLNIQRTLNSINEISLAVTLPENPSDAVPYITSIGTIAEMNDILLAAGKATLTNASPAIFAWSIILQTIREHALLYRESRENRQAQRAAERYGALDHSDTDGVERSSARGNRSRQRRSSTSSETSQQISFLEEVLDSIHDIAPTHDTIEFLATAAVDKGDVFSVITTLATDYCTTFGSEHDGKSGLKVRRMLLELMQAALQWIEYQPTLILATLAILTGNERYWDTLYRPQDSKDAEPAAFFYNDDSLMQNLYQTALTRFPYEALPFLKLSRALAIYNPEQDQGLPAIWSIFQKLESLTCVLPIDFAQYHDISNEEDDTSLIQLTGNLSFVSDGSRFSLTNSSRPNKPSNFLTKFTPRSDSQEVPSGTVGRVLSDSKPLIVMWQYDYSPLAYLGKILRCFSVDASLSTVTLDLSDTVSEAIGLLTAMISSAVQPSHETHASNTQDAFQTILQNASVGLEHDQDVISVIFQIFENELHRTKSTSEEERSLDILIQCIQFTHAVLPVMRDRVWSFLGRSSLLGIDGSQSQLSAIITSIEMVSGHYDFMLGCIKVFEFLIEDVIAHAVANKLPTTALKRFADTDSLGTGVSSSVMEKVVISFQRILVDVFESAPNWKFIVPEERTEMNTCVCLVFCRLLAYCFHIDGQSTASQKISRPLVPAADYLLDAFLSTSYSNLTLNPLLRILVEGAATPNSSLTIRGLRFWTSQVTAAIQFTTSLIRVNGLFKRPRSHLQQELFKATPVLAKVYAAHESYRLPIVELFGELIRSIDNADEQPPSLLGHLGQHTASSFLELLSITDQPFSDIDLSIGIWGLLSAIVSRRQQWFAIFILTGNTPRESFKDSEKTNSLVSQQTEPLLTIALDGLSNIERLEPMNAIAMLEFIASAADYWPWVIHTIEEHPHFLAAMTEYLKFPDLPALSTKPRSSQASADYVRLQTCSVILDVLAMYVNNTHQTGNNKLAKKLLPSLSFFSQHAVSVTGYNASLHRNLRHNFESKFRGCSLSAFKRTEANKKPLGKLFYYDLEIAEKMLNFDPAWIGKHGQGFAEEIARANINLSLTESQVNLLRSWKFFAVELSRVLGPDAKFQSIMVLTIVNCLRSNASSILPEAIFEQLAMSRAELAFTLLQNLVKLKSSNSELKNVLSAAWGTFRAHQTDVGLALAGESADYYRILLKILCLALQAHAPESESNDAISNTNTSVPLLTIQLVLEVVRVVVAQGFRSLITILHDDSTRILPADILLIVAVLRTGLRVPDIEKHSTQLVFDFSDNQTARCASALLSWADQITIDHDPVYGELSILFLLELSSIPALAESLAVEGVLTQVLSTNLITYLRRDRGAGPFDSQSRLYSIWARGVLPLLLNILAAVGAPMAAEIASSVNSFPSQLARASNIFLYKPSTAADPAAGVITFSMVSEAQTLAAITTILDTFREAGPSAGVITTQIEEPTWNKIQVRDHIEGLLQRRTALRDRIFPSNEKEEAWVRQPPVSSAGGAENRLEEKIVIDLNLILSILEGGEQ
ncbi:hypothetical protein MMC07_001236 [Pseudocyphellaria aurata]|nr:hypothetical protein [Pseudocyphellaria aurata]